MAQRMMITSRSPQNHRASNLATFSAKKNQIVLKGLMLLMLTPQEISSIAVVALDAKKAQDIKLLRTRDITILADYFLICTANSTTHIKTLSDEVEKALREKGEAPLRREGHRNGGWVLLDYACVIVHLFLREHRELYALERLWGDAEDVDLSYLAARNIN